MNQVAAPGALDETTLAQRPQVSRHGLLGPVQFLEELLLGHLGLGRKPAGQLEASRMGQSLEDSGRAVKRSAGLGLIMAYPLAPNISIFGMLDMHGQKNANLRETGGNFTSGHGRRPERIMRVSLRPVQGLRLLQSLVSSIRRRWPEAGPFPAGAHPNSTSQPCRGRHHERASTTTQCIH
jgi:hypothetical protein